MIIADRRGLSVPRFHTKLAFISTYFSSGIVRDVSDHSLILSLRNCAAANYGDPLRMQLHFERKAAKFPGYHD